MEDPKFLARHRYTLNPGPASKFAPTFLVLQNKEPGTFFAGGFETFEEATRGWRARARPATEEGPEAAAADPAAEQPARHWRQPQPSRPPPKGCPSFVRTRGWWKSPPRFWTRSATYVDDTEEGRFQGGGRGPHRADQRFENHTSGVSVALLLDTTGSMGTTLPALRSSALTLIEDLRPADSVAVYSFNAGHRSFNRSPAKAIGQARHPSDPRGRQPPDCTTP